MKLTRGRVFLLCSIAAVFAVIGAFVFGPLLLFQLMRGPDRLVSKEVAIEDYKARMQFIDRYQSILGDARERQDVMECNALPETVSFYQADQNGEVQYHPDYSGGPLVPGSLFALPRFDCVRAYAVDFVDASACDRGELNEIERQGCLMSVGHEMRRRNLSEWHEVCESIKTRDEREMCKQEAINPEKENLEIPSGLRYGDPVLHESILQKYLSQVPDDFEVTHVYGQHGAYLIATRKIESEDPFIVTFRVYGVQGDRLQLDYERTIDSGYAEQTHSLEDTGSYLEPVKIGMKDRFGYGTEWTDYYSLFPGKWDEGPSYSRILSLKYVRGGSLEIEYGGTNSTFSLMTDKECVQGVFPTQAVHVTGMRLGEKVYEFIRPLDAYCPGRGGSIWIDKVYFSRGAIAGVPLDITLGDTSRTTVIVDLESMSMYWPYGEGLPYRLE